MFKKGCFMFVGLCLSSIANAAPIELYKAVTDSKLICGSQTSGCTSQKFIQYDILVDNLAYDKDVAVRFEVNENLWTEKNATYVGSAGAGRELWRATKTLGDFETPVFALRYGVNGATYWDNNEGENYTVPYRSVYMRSTNVSLVNAPETLFTGSDEIVDFNGKVLVANIAPGKVVKIVYSTDNWQTVEETYASFSDVAICSTPCTDNPNAPEAEFWAFSIELTSDVDSIQYAIAYSVDGQTYWDNNFGYNYHTSIQ